MDDNYQLGLLVEQTRDMTVLYEGNIFGTDNKSHIVRFFLDHGGWVYGSYDGYAIKKLYNTFGINEPSDIEALKKSITNVYGSKLGNTSIFMRHGSTFEMLLAIYRWQTEDM